jgi:hypothetical protein
LSFNVYPKIVQINDQVDVVDQNGKPFSYLHGWKHALLAYTSSDQYEIEVPSTQTELANILMSAGHNVFTVQFIKKLQEETLL